LAHHPSYGTGFDRGAVAVLTNDLLSMLVTLGSAWLTAALVYLFLRWKRDAACYRKFRATGKTWFSLIGVLGVFLAALPLIVVQAFVVLLGISLLSSVLGALLAYLAVNHVCFRGLGIGLCLCGVVIFDVALFELLLVPAFGIISYVIGSGLVTITLILTISAIVRLPVPKGAEIS
jgi:hypothetical protein